MIKKAETSEEKDIERLAEGRAKKRAEKEAAAINISIFIPFLGIGFIMAFIGNYALGLGIPLMGTLIALLLYFAVKDDAYKKYYREELALLQRGETDEK